MSETEWTKKTQPHRDGVHLYPVGVRDGDGVG